MRRVRVCLRRFVPPWEQEGKTAEDFFGGILSSRNPLEKSRRDARRMKDQRERFEAEAAMDVAETSDELRARAAEEAEAAAQREFLPYGATPQRYFETSQMASWGTYKSSLGGHHEGGPSEVSSSSSSSSTVSYDHHTKMLLAADMDTELPYKYTALPSRPPPSKDAPMQAGPWPLFGTCGFVLDIDGVVYRSKKVIPGSDSCIRTLQALKIPFVFMTNGGGVHEAAKARELTALLQLEEPILEDQIILAHTPMQLLVPQHRHENVLVVGAGECEAVARAYGFEGAVSVASYQAQHPEMIPFRNWKEHRPSPAVAVSAPNSVPHEPFGAILVMNDMADTFNDCQVMLDVALSPMGRVGPHVCAAQTLPIYWGADDLLWATEAYLPRLGGGAMREMFCSVFSSVTGKDAEITQFGKPRAIQYAFAERRLQAVAARLGWDPSDLRTIAMVGDNLETDIKGANGRGGKWLSVHVLSGIGSAPAAVRTVSPGDAEMHWLADAVPSTPHYIAPTLDHFLREALSFGEANIVLNKKPFYGRPSPVDLSSYNL